MEPRSKADDQLRESIENRVREVADLRLARIGLDLVDAEYKREPGGVVLRLYIDKEGGVSLDDCQSASRTLEPVFETEGVDDLIPGPYNLEVSSPGLFRQLKRPRDFERAVGRRIKIRTHRALEGQKVFVGILDRLGEDHLFLRTGDAVFEIEMDNIGKANLEPELHF